MTHFNTKFRCASRSQHCCNFLSTRLPTKKCKNCRFLVFSTCSNLMHCNWARFVTCVPQHIFESMPSMVMTRMSPTWSSGRPRVAREIYRKKVVRCFAQLNSGNVCLYYLPPLGRLSIQFPRSHQRELALQRQWIRCILPRLDRLCPASALQRNPIQCKKYRHPTTTTWWRTGVSAQKWHLSDVDLFRRKTKSQTKSNEFYSSTCPLYNLPECCCIWSWRRSQFTFPTTVSPRTNGGTSLTTKWMASFPLRFTSTTSLSFSLPWSHGCIFLEERIVGIGWAFHTSIDLWLAYWPDRHPRETKLYLQAPHWSRESLLLSSARPFRIRPLSMQTKCVKEQFFSDHFIMHLMIDSSVLRFYLLQKTILLTFEDHFD